MDNLLKFFIEVGKLKRKHRRGWQMHQIKDSETTAEHTFRVAIIAWVLGERKKINIERVVKMALVHDLCEVYAPDITPYDPLIPKDKKKALEVLKRWPKFTSAMRVKKYNNKYKVELKSLEKLTAKLPKELRNEIVGLWLDFENGLSKEGRFVKQVDKMESLLQGLEYWKKYGKIHHKLWMRWAKEILDDPEVVCLMRTLEKKFC